MRDAGSTPAVGTKKTNETMQIEISKTNLSLLMTLIDKSVTIIQQKSPTNREYNVARQLRQVKKCIVRQIERQNGKTIQ